LTRTSFSVMTRPVYVYYHIHAECPDPGPPPPPPTSYFSIIIVWLVWVGGGGVGGVIPRVCDNTRTRVVSLPKKMSSSNVIIVIYSTMLIVTCNYVNKNNYFIKYILVNVQCKYFFIFLIIFFGQKNKVNNFQNSQVFHSLLTLTISTKFMGLTACISFPLYCLINILPFSLANHSSSLSRAP
jgi:hypothetical protein